MSEVDVLKEDATRWLENSKPVQDILGIGGSGGIIPVQVAAEKDDVDPRLSVGASTTSSSRPNTRVEETAELRVIVDATKGWVKPDGTDKGSILELTRLKSAVKETITENRDGWRAQGVTSDDEIQWEDSINRYMGVIAVEFERSSVYERTQRT